MRRVATVDKICMISSLVKSDSFKDFPDFVCFCDSDDFRRGAEIVGVVPTLVRHFLILNATFLRGVHVIGLHGGNVHSITCSLQVL